VDAIACIHRVARGLLRAVNNLARQSLVAAFANRSAIVDEKASRQAVAETDAE
jgi:type II secretory pathway predicted ATPase ExeA